MGAVGAKATRPHPGLLPQEKMTRPPVIGDNLGGVDRAVYFWESNGLRGHTLPLIPLPFVGRGHPGGRSWKPVWRGSC